MPGPITTLLPPEFNRPAGSAPAVPVPSSLVPRFAAPKHVVSDGFFSNLKQFLVERPVKLNGAVNSPLMPSTYGGGFSENLREFFSSRPVPKGPVNSRLAVSWGTSFGGFGYRIKEFFSPTKMAPLQVTSKPIKVKDIWSKDENFGWTQILSVGLHVAIMALIIAPFIMKLSPTTQAKNPVDVTPIDISDYMSKLPAGADKAGGGGGGGDRSILPPTKGKPPIFKSDSAHASRGHSKNPSPEVAGRSDPARASRLKVQSPNLNNMGDPMAASVIFSGGPAVVAASVRATTAVLGAERRRSWPRQRWRHWWRRVSRWHERHRPARLHLLPASGIFRRGPQSQVHGLRPSRRHRHSRRSRHRSRRHYRSRHGSRRKSHRTCEDLEDESGIGSRW